LRAKHFDAAQAGRHFFSMTIASKPSNKTLQWAFWGILFAVILVVFGLFARQRMTTTKSKLPVISVLRDFSLTNQNGATVTLDDLRGKVWVADIIFTRCPGPCRRMTKDFARLQELWPNDAPVRFVSLTTDPTNDTSAVLKRYAQEFKADPDRWHFLTGPKKEIVDLAVGGMKLTALDKEESLRQSADDMFIHSTIFVIVDKRGQVRATVESDNDEALTRTKQLVEELLHER
jgi:protein SCO1